MHIKIQGKTRMMTTAYCMKNNYKTNGMANTGYSSASCMFLQYPAVATDYNPKYMYGKKSGHYFL